MNTKAAKTKAKSALLNPVQPVETRRRPGRPRKIAYEVRTLPQAGNSGRLGVVEINGVETTLIARYHTLDTAAWVRDVMQAAAKA